MTNVVQQWLTLAILVGVACFLIASDVWLIRTVGVEASYSRVVAHLLQRHPVVLVVAVFGLGVLVGHVLLNTYPR